MKTKDALTLLAVLGVGYLAWKSYSGIKSAAGAAVQAAATYLNPASPQNIAYTSVNDVGAALTGQPAGNFSLGSDWWSVVNPVPSVQETQAVGAQPTQAQLDAATLYTLTNPATPADTTATTSDTTTPSYAPLTQFTPSF